MTRKFRFEVGDMKQLKAGSQNSRLLAHLSRGRTVTSMEAFRRFGVTSLHRRLEELRERGHRIDRGEFYTTKAGVRVKRYRLAKH
jgi:hypothetical protein